MDALKYTRESATNALSMPPQLVNMYGDFISKNASAVSQIESGLRSLSYFIPGRIHDSEIMSESLQSGVQLLSLYHDSLLARAVAKLPTFRRPQVSPHNRYTKFWTQKSPTYHRLAVLIKVLQHTELLWEMMAKRRGEKVRWRVVILLEAIKALCRLLLLRLTNSRPLLSPPLPEREVDPKVLEEQNPDTDERARNGPESPPSEPSDATSHSDIKWTMPRTGLSLPSLPESSDISSYLLSKVLTADDIKPPPSLMNRVSGKGEIAEWLHILRPLIYACICAQYRNNKKSWSPWLMGLSIEWGARQLAKQAVRERSGVGLRGLSKLEREELKRRGWAMAWWMMRGAFYENITKGWIDSAAGVFKGKTLIDMIGVVIEDYEFLWGEYYFTSATM